MTETDSGCIRLRCECRTLLTAPCSCAGLEALCPVCKKPHRIPTRSDSGIGPDVDSQPVLPRQDYAPVIRSITTRLREMIVWAAVFGIAAFFIFGFAVPVIAPIFTAPSTITDQLITGNAPKPSEWEHMAGMRFSMVGAMCCGFLGVIMGFLRGWFGLYFDKWGKEKDGISTCICIFHTDTATSEPREVHFAVLNTSAQPKTISPPLNVNVHIKYRPTEPKDKELIWQEINQEHVVQLPPGGLVLNPGCKREFLLMLFRPPKKGMNYTMKGTAAGWDMGAAYCTS